MAGDYHINDIYQGGYSSLKPKYGDVFTGYRTSAGSLGLTTDHRTANIIQDASSKLATGIKQIEISAVQPEIFESIPQQHLKEMKRLAKITGVDVSVHGPILEASGLSREGFTESNRRAVERQMNSAVERSHEINPDGNIPVTFHSSAMLPGTILENKKEKPEEILIINRENGSINRVPLKEIKDQGRFPEEGEINAKQEINRYNEELWRQSLSHLSYNSRHAEEIIENSKVMAIAAEAEKKKGNELMPEHKKAMHAFNYANNFLNDAYREFKGIYESAYQYAATEDKDKIVQLGKKISAQVKEINKSESEYEKTTLKQEVIEEGIETLKDLAPPQKITELNDFAKDKTTDTFAGVAFNSYKKFKDTSPIISIENPPAGGAFSTGKELKEIIEKSRDKFVQKAKEEGISEKEARSAAEKIIGATWDVGHINMMRKFGYESKDIVKESEAVAKLVKHIHLSDNFGFEHTELPMGMGNVPIKDILNKLGKEGFDAKKIIEAGNWWQHFRTPPVKETMEAFGSPIYGMEMAPYWNQNLGLQQGYFGGMEGQWLPQVNYETFGTGFSQLPGELGGQRPGAQGSRMSGKGME